MESIKSCKLYNSTQGWQNKGRGGHAPKKFEWGGGQGMFPPPHPLKILTTGPPRMGDCGQNLCQIASKYPEMCKIFRLLQIDKGRSSLHANFRL